MLAADILSILKVFLSAYSTSKKAYEAWQQSTEKKGGFSRSEGSFVAPTYIEPQVWRKVLSALTDVRNERPEIFSAAKLRVALEAIYEVEARINAHEMRQHHCLSLAERSRYLRRDRIVPGNAAIFEGIDRLQNGYNAYQYFNPTLVDYPDIQKLDGTTVYLTPSYIGELLAIENICDSFSISIKVVLSKSSFLESANHALAEGETPRSYIVGVDVSCMHILSLYAGSMAIVDMTGRLRNRLLFPHSDTEIFFGDGKLLLPFGERSSTFHYSKTKFSQRKELLKNVDEITAYSSLLGLMGPESPNFAVAWSPYWQLIAAIGRAKLAIGPELDQQPYANWLLRLNASEKTIDHRDRLFGALIRSQMRLLGLNDRRLSRQCRRVVEKYEIDKVVGGFLKLNLI